MDKKYRRASSVALEWQGRMSRLIVGANGKRLPAEPPLVGLLARLGDWTTRSELIAEGFEIAPKSLDVLATLGVLQVSMNATSANPVEPLQTWHAFDLDIQRVQSAGRISDPMPPAPPAFKQAYPGPRTSLPCGIDPEMSLATALRLRRSIRHYAPQSLGLDAVGALLFRAARVNKVTRDPFLGEIVYHPYASAGARSELEIYVVANRVDGLTAGVHHYDAIHHQLVMVLDRGARQDDFNLWASESVGQSPGTGAHATLVITAVFERLFWKYGRFGLTLAYQNLGCLYQTLYLVATALQLAPCAIGAGRSGETAHWIGFDQFVETPIGYFALGSL